MTRAILFALMLAACSGAPAPGPSEAERNAEVTRQFNWCAAHYPTCAGRPLDAWFWNYLADHPDGFRLEGQP